jgi:hypothetical protein
MADTETEEIVELSFEPEPLFERYSTRHEFPISLVGAALILLFTFGLVYVVMRLIDKSNVDTTPVPISLVDPGDDDSGAGSPGGAGNPDDGAISLQPPTPQDFAPLLEKIELPEVKAELQKAIQIDPNGTTYIPDEKAAAFGALSEELRKKMLNNGGQGGNPGPMGTNSEPGTGKGGIGANSTLARTIRWVLRLRTDGGKDYLNQLGAMGAIVVVPLPPDNKRGYRFTNPKNPGAGELIDEVEWSKYANMIQFCDFKRQSVQEVATALNIKEQPNCFWAYFPKSLEHELARKEEAYHGRRAEEIAETVFQVIVREGNAEVFVTSQKLK